MAAGESKGGSDLDVFEGLGKKVSTRAPGTAGAQRTSAPPPPPSLRQTELKKTSTLQGVAAVPPPVSTSPVSVPQVPVPVPRTPPPPPGRAALPPVVPPPSKAPSPSSSGKAAAAAPQAAPRAAAGGLDMDWDEEEEATHVLDRDAPPPSAAVKAPTPTSGLVSRPPPPTNKQTLLGLTSPAQTPPPPSARPPSMPPPPPSAGFARASSPPGGPTPSAPPPAVAPPPMSVRPAAGGAPVSQNGSNGHAAAAFPYQQNTAPMPMPVRTASIRSASSALDDAPVLPAPTRSRMMEATALVRPRPRRTGLFVGIGVGAVVMVGALLFLLPHSGQIAINVADSKGSAVQHLQFSVDGKLQQCDSAPCIVHDLSAGSHTVKVEAPGYEQPADKAVAVESRKDTTVDFVLSPSAPAGGTGLKVAGTQAGEKLFIDDREVGALPQELHDLTPGSHRVRVAAGDRYAAVEKNVTIAKDEFQDLGTVTLKVIKGRVTVSLGTPGAKVFLISGSDRRELPTLPMSINLDPAKQWSLVATRAGYNDFSQALSFDDGQAEKTAVVTLEAKTASSGSYGGSMSFSPRHRSRRPPIPHR